MDSGNFCKCCKEFQLCWECDNCNEDIGTPDCMCKIDWENMVIKAGPNHPGQPDGEGK